MTSSVQTPTSDLMIHLERNHKALGLAALPDGSVPPTLTEQHPAQPTALTPGKFLGTQSAPRVLGISGSGARFQVSEQSPKFRSSDPWHLGWGQRESPDTCHVETWSVPGS